MNRITKYSLAALSSLVIFSAAALYLALYTDFGIKTALSKLNGKLPGKISVTSSEITFFGPQKFEGLALHDPKGNLVAEASYLRSDSSLINLLARDLFSKGMVIENLNLDLKSDEKGISNLQYALGTTLPNAPLSFANSDLELKNVQASLNFGKSKDLADMQISGLAKQGGAEGTFDIRVQADPHKLDTSTISGQVKNFPIKIIEQFASLNDPSLSGLIIPLFGKSIDMEFDQKRTASGLGFHINAASPTLQAKLSATIKNGVLELLKPGEIHFRFSQESFSSLLSALGRNDALYLPRDINLDVGLESLSVPLRGKGPRELKVSLKNLPLKHVEAIFKIDGLQDILGKTASVAVEIHKENQNALHLTLNSEKASIPLLLAAQNTFSLGKIKKSPFKGKLESKQIVYRTEGSIYKLYNVSLPIDLDISKKELHAVLHAEQIDLSNESSRNVLTFKNFNGNIESDNAYATLKFHGNAKAIHGKNEGTIEVNGQLLSMASGNASKPSMELKLSGRELPTMNAVHAAGLDDKMAFKAEALLGPSVNVDLHAQLSGLNGTVKGIVFSPYGRVHLNGNISNNRLFLNEPFVVEAEITPKLSQVLLQEYLPVLKGALKGEDRIRLTIDPEGFEADFKDPLKGIRIEKSSLELGRLLFANEGQLGRLAGLLNAPKTDTLSVWFTPIYFSYQDTMLNIARFDLLIQNRYPIAGWGSVNFSSRYIDLMVGLTGEAIRNAFKVPVEDQYILQLPLRGPIGNAKLDKSKAIAKLSALVASVSAGPQGLLLGSVIGLAAGSMSEPTPQPTTNPLPWKIDQAGNKEIENWSENEKPVKKKNPFHKFEEGASQLLNGLLGSKP